MAIKNILQFPNSMLAQSADLVVVFDEKIAELSADLRETAKAFNAEGLAATQVGALYRMFVIKDHTTNEYITCINPVITTIQVSPDLDSVEGCLSFPGVYEKVKRHSSIRVSYQDEGGVETDRTLSEVNAVAFQHELDHLNGIVFTAHMGKLQKHLALKKLEKTKRLMKRQSQQIEAMMTKELAKVQEGRKTLHTEVVPATV